MKKTKTILGLASTALLLFVFVLALSAHLGYVTNYFWKVKTEEYSAENLKVQKRKNFLFVRAGKFEGKKTIKVKTQKQKVKIIPQLESGLATLQVEEERVLLASSSTTSETKLKASKEEFITVTIVGDYSGSFTVEFG
ncbi:MAG: hypothetical protein LBM95_01315 [Lactobacillales bacterium]|jgi:hypothetical protein|nr:hypothetical protein [Lactobacillales bacterium]